MHSYILGLSSLCRSRSLSQHTGEETKNPEKVIPTSIISALLIIMVSYCSVATVVTLMCPYYLIDVDTPLPFVFSYVGWDVAQYIIAIGAMCGLSTRWVRVRDIKRRVRLRLREMSRCTRYQEMWRCTRYQEISTCTRYQETSTFTR